MSLTQFETDSITRAIVALERIADALETIRDRMPEVPVPDGPAELDPEPVPCYILDEHNEHQPCIRRDGNCDKCPRDIALRKELDKLIEQTKGRIECSNIEGGKHA